MARHRLLWLTIGLAVSLAACGAGTEPTASPGASAELAETRLAACVNDQGDIEPAEPTGRAFKTIKAGTLVVGSDTAFPPFESIEDGKAVGFDIDLVNEVAKRIGNLKVEVQSAAFDTIFTALAAGRFDVVVSAVTIKAERKQTVDFSEPYFKADQSLTVTEDDTAEIGGVEALAGKAVGVQAGTTGEDCAKNALKEGDKVGEIRSFETAVDAFNDLSAGRVDAVLVDLPTAQQVVASRDGLVVVQKVLTAEDYGIAVSKENPDLRVAIDEALGEIRDDGTYDRLYRKWFKSEPPE